MSLPRQRSPENNNSLEHALIPWLLGLLLLFQAGMAYAWLHIDQLHPYWDEATYLFQGVIQLDALRQGGIQSWYHTWVSMDRTRVALISTLMMPSYAILGYQADAALVSNAVSWLLSILGVYAAGTAIADRRVGLLSALLFCCSPTLIGLVHIVLAETLLVACIAWSLWALVQSQGHDRPGYSVLAGLFTGLGMLAKVHCSVFLIGPWIVSLWQMMRTEAGWHWPSARRWLGLAGGAMAILASAGPWYLPNLPVLYERTSSASFGQESVGFGPANPWYWRNLLIYLMIFVSWITSVPGMLLVLLGFGGIVANRREAWRRGLVWVLAASVLIGYLVFTGLPNQDIKHVVGVTPALFILAGWGLTLLFRRRGWGWAALLVGLLMVLNTVMGTLPGRFEDRTWTVKMGQIPMVLYAPAQNWVRNTKYAAPSSQTAPIETIMDYAMDVADLKSLDKEKVLILVQPDTQDLEKNALEWDAWARHLPAQLFIAHPQHLADADMLLTKTGRQGWIYHQPLVDAVNAELARFDYHYNLMPYQIPLLDGSNALLYAKRPSPLLQETPDPEIVCKATFANAGTLLGVDTRLSQSQEGQHLLDTTYYWETHGPLSTDPKLFVHVVDPDSDSILAQDDHDLFVRVYPPSKWQEGRIVCDHRQVLLPKDYDQGPLVLRVGLYDASGRLPVQGAGLENAATHLDLWLE